MWAYLSLSCYLIASLVFAILLAVALVRHEMNVLGWFKLGITTIRAFGVMASCHKQLVGDVLASATIPVAAL
jgi:hypothetical protein